MRINRARDLAAAEVGSLNFAHREQVGHGVTHEDAAIALAMYRCIRAAQERNKHPFGPSFYLLELLKKAPKDAAEERTALVAADKKRLKGAQLSP